MVIIWLNTWTNPCISTSPYVMAKRENLNKLDLSLLKTLTLKEELVRKFNLSD
jgi:hypothetical protein